MAVDKYGLLKLYPTKTGGLEWFNKWDNKKRRNLGKQVEVDPYDSNFRVTCGSPNVNVLFKGDGVARFRSNVPVTSIRFWVTGPWTNTEMTCQICKIDTMPDIQMRSRANHLTSGDAYQTVFGNYAANWGSDDKQLSLAVEPMHPIYKRYIVTKAISEFPINSYVSFKQITRTVGGNTVLLEAYFNATSDQTKWTKQLEYTFTSTNITYTLTAEEEAYRLLAVDQGDLVANDLTAASCWLNDGDRCWLRMNNGTSWNMRKFSVREIDPVA